mmetsp:Transcript_51118/g.110788  ORF Transcript_51118/g.110788 Transcript_51118/m.110788 type:complete len:634 (+) Transcript_51118:340-2241(+)
MMQQMMQQQHFLQQSYLQQQGQAQMAEQDDPKNYALQALSEALDRAEVEHLTRGKRTLAHDSFGEVSMGMGTGRGSAHRHHQLPLGCGDLGDDDFLGAVAGGGAGGSSCGGGGRSLNYALQAATEALSKVADSPPSTQQRHAPTQNRVRRPPVLDSPKGSRRSDANHRAQQDSVDLGARRSRVHRQPSDDEGMHSSRRSTSGRRRSSPEVQGQQKQDLPQQEQPYHQQQQQRQQQQQHYHHQQHHAPYDEQLHSLAENSSAALQGQSLSPESLNQQPYQHLDYQEFEASSESRQLGQEGDNSVDEPDHDDAAVGPPLVSRYPAPASPSDDDFDDELEALARREMEEDAEHLQVHDPAWQQISHSPLEAASSSSAAPPSAAASSTAATSTAAPPLSGKPRVSRLPTFGRHTPEASRWSPADISTAATTGSNWARGSTPPSMPPEAPLQPKQTAASGGGGRSASRRRKPAPAPEMSQEQRRLKRDFLVDCVLNGDNSASRGASTPRAAAPPKTLPSRSGIPRGKGIVPCYGSKTSLADAERRESSAQARSPLQEQHSSQPPLGGQTRRQLSQRDMKTGSRVNLLEAATPREKSSGFQLPQLSGDGSARRQPSSTKSSQLSTSGSLSARAWRGRAC